MIARTQAVNAPVRYFPGTLTYKPPSPPSNYQTTPFSQHAYLAGTYYVPTRCSKKPKFCCQVAEILSLHTFGQTILLIILLGIELDWVPHLSNADPCSKNRPGGSRNHNPYNIDSGPTAP